MKFALLLAALTQEPLYIVPEKGRQVIALLEARAFGGPMLPVAGNAAAAVSEPGVVRYYDDEREMPEPPPLYTEETPGVAVIPVAGLIGKRLSGMALMCGGCDIDTVARALRAAAADTNVSTIVLDINTPGGMGIGLAELSTLIGIIDQVKPVVAFTDMQCCSAGYWIAAACREFYCTPSSIVGSIGAYLAFEDDSQAWQMAGRERLVFNGDATYKGMGTPGKKWTPEEKAFMQARSVKATAAIRAAAQAHRTLDESTMQGQSFDGDDAARLGLVDGLFNSREEMLAMLTA